MILGHRGAREVCRENTLEAFTRAFDDGADGVELDVRLCRSGELVVLHDAALDRVWGRGGPIWHLDLADLRALAPGLPTLDETWDAIASRGLVNVEVKAGPIPWEMPKSAWPTPSWRATSTAVSRWIRRRRLRRASADLLLSSFDPRILAWLGVFAPGVRRALVFEVAQRYPVDPLRVARAMRCKFIHPEHPVVDAAFVSRAHAKGIGVTAWTVGTADEVKRLRELDVDGIVTNDPARTRAFLGAPRGESVDPPIPPARTS